MTQKRYEKPAVRVRQLQIALLNTVSGPDMPWGAKQNSISPSLEVEEGVNELNRMFE